jgi:hypothetical protein
MPLFTEHMQTADEMIAGIPTGTTPLTEGFRLRAEAPEFVPEKKLEAETA